MAAPLNGSRVSGQQISDGGRVYAKAGFATVGGSGVGRIERILSIPGVTKALRTDTPRQRPRESRRRSSSRTSVPRGDPSDPEPPDPPRRCKVCGGSLEGRRRHAQTCGSRCRVAKHRHGALTPAEKAALERRYEAALRIVRRLPVEERLSLLCAVVWPTDARLRDAA